MGPPLRDVLLDPDQVRADSTSLTLFLPEPVVRDADLQIRFRTVLYTPLRQGARRGLQSGPTRTVAVH